MIRLFKHILTIFYENENYSKYGRSGMNYFMALFGGTFYIMMTGGMLFIIAAAVFPKFYRYSLGIHFGTSSKIGSLTVIGLIMLLLRSTIKEEELSNNGLTKEYVKKAVNYLLAYIFVVVIIIGFVALKYLRRYNPQ